MDNFNGTPGEDIFLDEQLKYRLRILFTTRGRYEEQPSQEVKERVMLWKQNLIENGYVVRSINSMIASVNSFPGVLNR